VILETCAEAFGVADTAAEHGHEVRVVPALLVRQLGVGARGVKTDQRDARALSEASCRLDLPSVHICSARSRALKSTCAGREALIRARTKLINNVRGWLRGQAKSMRKGGTETFPPRLRALLDEQPDGWPAHVERSLHVLDELNCQIKEADVELKEMAVDDPICTRLMTVPGVGPLTAVRFLAAVDERARFGSSHALESYLGLTPGENSSSERKMRTGITKAGCKMVRWTLVQAAWSAMRTRPQDPMVRWAQDVAARRGRKIAAVALARKIAGILYALWRDGTCYDPVLNAPAESTAEA
jgi:transposase